MARGLKTNKSKTIGILIPNLEQPFCTSIVANIENILINYGYSTILCDYKESMALQKKKLKFLVSKMVDGIIMMPLGDEGKMINEVLTSDTPLVLVDRILEDVNCDAILVDNVNASYEAVQQFIIRGHKKIAIITGPSNIYTAKERLKGYYRAFEDYDMTIDQSLVLEGDYKVNSGYNLLKQLMSQSESPTAVFVTNYEMTLGAIIAINEDNIMIPEELSIIGFDNLELMSVVKPKLSLVSQPIKEIGECVAKILLRRIQGDFANYPVRMRLRGNVEINESVKNM